MGRVASQTWAAVHPGWSFLAAATVVWATGTTLLRHLGAARDSRLVALGVAFDLTITVTFLAWWFPVRRRVWPAKALFPVFLLSLAAARRVVPSEGADFFAALKWLAVPLEIGLVAWIGVRAAAALLSSASVAPDADRLSRIQRAARSALWSRHLADAVAFELAVLVYALGPREKAPERDGRTPFTYHRKVAYGPVVGALTLVILAETAALHLLVARWRPEVAWLLTAVGLYTIVYLVADWRAAKTRPILLGEKALELRTGLRWKARLPLAAIAKIERRAPSARGEKPLRAALLGGANLWLTLSEPATAEGPYGRTRQVRQVALFVDEPGALAAALDGARRPPVEGG